MMLALQQARLLVVIKLVLLAQLGLNGTLSLRVSSALLTVWETFLHAPVSSTSGDQGCK